MSALTRMRRLRRAWPTALRLLAFASFSALELGPACGQEMAAPAAPPPGPPLSLERVTRAALQKNPALKAARATWQAKRERIEQEAAWEDPKLTFRSLLGRFVDIGPNGFTDQMVSLEQAIPVSGKNKSRARIALAEALAAFQDLRRQELDVVAKTRAAFFRLSNEDALLELNEANDASLALALAVTRARLEVGAQSQADALLAETERQRVIEARRDLERKRSDDQSALNVLMNADPFAPLGKPVVALRTAPERGAEALRLQTLANRPEVLRASADFAAAQASLQLARRQWVPDPTLTLQADHYNASSRVVSEVSGGVSINLPWPNAKKYRAGEREAQDRLIAAGQMLEGAKTESLGKLRDQLKTIETLRHHLELYETSILPSARQALTANQADYENNKTGLLNVLTSQRGLYELEAMYQQDLTDYRVALADLEALVGSALGFF